MHQLYIRKWYDCWQRQKEMLEEVSLLALVLPLRSDCSTQMVLDNSTDSLLLSYPDSNMYNLMHMLYSKLCSLFIVCLLISNSESQFSILNSQFSILNSQ